LDKLKRESNQWTPIFVGEGRLQVANNCRTHVHVDLDAQTCPCRMWQLTSISTYWIMQLKWWIMQC